MIFWGLVALLLEFVTCNKTSKSSKCASNFDDNDGPMKFEIFMPYQLDFYAEMKLSSIFPRKFLYVLKDYKKSKDAGKPILFMPNLSSGALKLGTVRVENGRGVKQLMGVLDSISKRVFRTGFNERTASGNFRLPLNGVGIDPETSLLYAKVDLNYPTDSYERFVMFIKTLFHRFRHEKLSFETWTDHKIDQFIIGKVESLGEINMKAFNERFATKFLIGFVTFSSIMVSPLDARRESMKSIFYFDYMSHEPIIEVENKLEDDDGEASETDLDEERVIPDHEILVSTGKKQSKSQKKKTEEQPVKLEKKEIKK